MGETTDKYKYNKKNGVDIMPKVSIVLPAYNGSKYLNKAIDSIIHQTFDNWELILVNDCSMDNTLKIMETYAKLDSRIKVINNLANQKLPRSLNIGFEVATGEYLTWTSDDNIYHNLAIGAMVDFLDKNKEYAMVRTNMFFINEDGKITGKSECYTKRGMMINNYVGACFMYRNCVKRDIGGYDDNFFCVEDYEYWIRILENYGQIGNIDVPLYFYRQHSESLTVTKRDLVEEQLSKMRGKYIDFFIKQLVGDEKGEYQLYLIMLNCNIKKDIIEEKIKDNVLVNSDKELKFDKPIAVYGAGYYGRKVYDFLGGKISCYVDRNDSIIGEDINGVPVISVSEFFLRNERYNVVIALSVEKIYEAVKELLELGLEEYTSYHLLEYSNNIT